MKLIVSKKLKEYKLNFKKIKIKNMARPLVTKYEALEDAWFKVYDTLSNANFEIYVEDNLMSVGSRKELVKLKSTEILVWLIAIQILNDNNFRFHINRNGMSVFPPENLNFMNDEEEGMCIIHDDDLLDFNDRQSELDEELYGIDD
jgi:hypothetical protein